MEAKNEYEIKAIVDGVIIERHIAKTLAEQDKKELVKFIERQLIKLNEYSIKSD